ncbi:flavin-containing monooxygenase [Pseudofrankia inefficax]|nr:NAD(P)/FAD-dependent oxidoreductase [Pseudofrankia inefficax]
MTTPPSPTATDFEAIVIGAGVAGIYQLHAARSLGLRCLLVDAGPDLGGTWYNNRYPGCRFDSESYSYGYSFSADLLREWHWVERFSPQPENLRYLNFVADRLELRPYMRFGFRVERASWDEAALRWRIRSEDGQELTARFLLPALGQLSIPTSPRFEGAGSFQGRAFHTFDWPHDGIDLRGRRVGVVGTGATGIQVISSVAGEVSELYVFQRRPNWSAPLNNSPISAREMADIRRRYAEIFEACAATPGGFIHGPDQRAFDEVPREERLALWEKLYDEPGFGIWLANFKDIFVEGQANREISDFIAEKIRERVADPAVAAKLIPTDHGFGSRRLPLETRYFEVYNQPNVTLVDLQETPVERLTAKGIRTTAREYELDVIVYATGFDAITGAYDRIDIRGVDGQLLRDKWDDGPVTHHGLASRGFPNLLMVAGPQSASASTNYPRGIETSVEWITGLLRHLREHGYHRVEATAQAEQDWVEEAVRAYDKTLIPAGKGWVTGANSNIPGREQPRGRPLIYTAGAPRYRKTITRLAEAGYEGFELS